MKEIEFAVEHTVSWAKPPISLIIYVSQAAVYFWIMHFIGQGLFPINFSHGPYNTVYIAEFLLCGTGNWMKNCHLRIAFQASEAWLLLGRNVFKGVGSNSDSFEIWRKKKTCLYAR